MRMLRECVPDMLSSVNKFKRCDRTPSPYLDAKLRKTEKSGKKISENNTDPLTAVHSIRACSKEVLCALLPIDSINSIFRV